MIRELWCIGAYESTLADYFPSHVQPILALRTEQDGQVLWRRIVYIIERPHRLELVRAVGPYVPMDDLSVFKGDYIRCEPFPIDVCDQTVVLRGHRLVAVRSLRQMLRVLAAELLATRTSTFLQNARLTLRNFTRARQVDPPSRRQHHREKSDADAATGARESVQSPPHGHQGWLIESEDRTAGPLLRS